MKWIAIGIVIIGLSALSFVAGVMWSSSPVANTKSAMGTAQPSAGRPPVDDKEELQTARRLAIEGLKTVGIINEWTRRHLDLNLTVAPSFNAIDPKSKTAVCELVYSYLVIMPPDSKLSDFSEVLKVHDGETGNDLGVYSPKTGLRLQQPDKSKQK